MIFAFDVLILLGIKLNQHQNRIYIWRVWKKKTKILTDLNAGYKIQKNLEVVSFQVSIKVEATQKSILEV